MPEHPAGGSPDTAGIGPSPKPAEKGRLVAFPESFLPGFPLWALVHAPIDTHDFFRRLYEHSIETHGPDVERVATMARRHGVYLSVGVTERSPSSVGTLYNKDR